MMNELIKIRRTEVLMKPTKMESYPTKQNPHVYKRHSYPQDRESEVAVVKEDDDDDDDRGLSLCLRFLNQALT